MEFCKYTSVRYSNQILSLSIWQWFMPCRSFALLLTVHMSSARFGLACWNVDVQLSSLTDWLTDGLTEETRGEFWLYIHLNTFVHTHPPTNSNADLSLLTKTIPGGCRLMHQSAPVAWLPGCSSWRGNLSNFKYYMTSLVCWYFHIQKFCAYFDICRDIHTCKHASHMPHSRTDGAARLQLDLHAGAGGGGRGD